MASCLAVSLASPWAVVPRRRSLELAPTGSVLADRTSGRKLEGEGHGWTGWRAGVGRSRLAVARDTGRPRKRSGHVGVPAHTRVPRRRRRPDRRVPPTLARISRDLHGLQRRGGPPDALVLPGGALHARRRSPDARRPRGSPPRRDGRCVQLVPDPEAARLGGGRRRAEPRVVWPTARSGASRSPGRRHAASRHPVS